MMIFKVLNTKHELKFISAFKAAGFKVWGKTHSFSEGTQYRVELTGANRESERATFKQVLSSTAAQIRAESEAKRGGKNYGR